MQLTVFAVGRMKDGPERMLVERYLDRVAKSGPAVGLSFSGVSEIAESRAARAGQRKAEESAQCLDRANERATALIALDETGKSVTSKTFAELLARMRDSGTRRVIFAIGGPDGHAPELLGKADRIIALGLMTWPHQIVRVLVAEQLYRAVSILAGHPYHRS